MNITRENTGNLTARIKVEISESDYSEKVKKALKDYQKQAVIPGFRKGTASIQLISRMYGKAVLIDEVQDVLSKSIADYLTENKLDLLGRPIPDTQLTEEIDWDTQKDFTFYFDIAMSPEFAINFPDIKASYFTIEPDEATIDEYVKNVAQQYGKVETFDTYTEKNPSVLLYGEFQELDESKEPKKEGIESATYLDVNKIESEEIQQMFLGKSVNDFVDFEYKKAFSNAADISAMLKIQKKEAEAFNGMMRFTIEEVSKLVPHELNEELYKKAFPNKEITTEKAFREELTHEFSKTYEKESDKKFFNDVVKELIDKTEIELPEDFLKRWVAHTSEKHTPEQIEEGWETYKSSFKWELIENKLTKDFDIKIEEQELLDFVKERYLRGYFPGINENEENKEMSNRMNDIAKSVLDTQERREQVVHAVLDNKFTDLFKAQVKSKNKKGSFDDFLKELK